MFDVCMCFAKIQYFVSHTRKVIISYRSNIFLKTLTCQASEERVNILLLHQHQLCIHYLPIIGFASTATPTPNLYPLRLQQRYYIPSTPALTLYPLLLQKRLYTHFYSSSDFASTFTPAVTFCFDFSSTNFVYTCTPTLIVSLFPLQHKLCIHLYTKTDCVSISIPAPTTY